jgi:2-keto-4-pentenoate hydratase
LTHRREILSNEIGPVADGGVTVAAARLARAWTDRAPCAPIRDLIGAANMDGAYAVQRFGRARRVAAGAEMVGWKIGLTSEAVQRQLGVDQPDFGVLFADMAVPDGATIGAGRLLQPRIEAEIAFILADDLDGPTDIDTVRAGLAWAIPALEIVDSRIAGWDITIVDTVADNASCGLFVSGGTRTPTGRIDPPAVAMRLVKDQTTVSTGSGTACLGDPIAAVAWLATAAAAYGEPLRAGQMILSGALGPMVDLEPGTYRADLTDLGSVSVTVE